VRNWWYLGESCTGQLFIPERFTTILVIRNFALECKIKELKITFSIRERLVPLRRKLHGTTFYPEPFATILVFSDFALKWKIKKLKITFSICEKLVVLRRKLYGTSF
jgi:hypothetical protein